tara:strand:+ start:3450 stop:4115 length:666 start_codon:yes stop_codon:yes gene_type:complete
VSIHCETPEDPGDPTAPGTYFPRGDFSCGRRLVYSSPSITGVLPTPWLVTLTLALVVPVDSFDDSGEESVAFATAAANGDVFADTSPSPLKRLSASTNLALGDRLAARNPPDMPPATSAAAAAARRAAHAAESDPDPDSVRVSFVRAKLASTSRSSFSEERSCVISVETVAGAAAACVTRVVLRAIFGLTGFDDVLVVELKFSFVCRSGRNGTDGLEVTET